jgi:hypothetical protein
MFFHLNEFYVVIGSVSQYFRLKIRNLCRILFLFVQTQSTLFSLPPSDPISVTLSTLHPKKVQYYQQRCKTIYISTIYFDGFSFNILFEKASTI